jgi:hypothetical protein
MASLKHTDEDDFYLSIEKIRDIQLNNRHKSMKERIQDYNTCIEGKIMGRMDHVTFRTGDMGIEARGFYLHNSTINRILIEKHRSKIFCSNIDPRDLDGINGNRKLTCDGFRVPIKTILISPNDNIMIESKTGGLVEIRGYHDFAKIEKGYNLSQIMDKFPVINF